MDKLGIIYRAINIRNGKSYVGQTYQKFERRKASHLRAAFNTNDSTYDVHFHRAIRKYGPDVFIWTIVAEEIPIEELNWYERFYVYYHSAFGQFGYNGDTGGGNGRKVGEETKKKMSLKSKGNKYCLGRKATEETKIKMSLANKGENNHFFGKVRSKESLEKMSVSHTGHHYNKGKHTSPNTEFKIGHEGLKGEKNPMFGTHFSNDTRNKISISRWAQSFSVYIESSNVLVGTWINQCICAEELTLKKGSIGKCLRGHQISHQGYIFQYNDPSVDEKRKLAVAELESRKLAAERKRKQNMLSKEKKKGPHRFSKGSVPWNKGIKLPSPSEETRTKQSASLRGEKHPFFGKHHSKESIAKMLETKNVKPFSVYEKVSGDFVGIWLNQKECAKALLISDKHISSCLHGHRKSHHGYIFRYVESLAGIQGNTQAIEQDAPAIEPNSTPPAAAQTTPPATEDL